MKRGAWRDTLIVALLRVCDVAPAVPATTTARAAAAATALAMRIEVPNLGM